MPQLKLLRFISLFLFLATSANANTPPLKSDPFGSPGGSTSYNYLLGLINALSAQVSALGSLPGTIGSAIINGGAALYGAIVPDSSATATSSFTNNGFLSPQAEASITSGLRIDPRGYGAKCTGWYGLSSVGVAVGGTGFVVGDTFIALDDNLGNMNGYVVVPAKGHVTAATPVVSPGVGGVVTAVVLDTPGSGYHNFVSFNVMPTSGKGDHLTLQVTGLKSGPAAAPSITLVSGGGPGVNPTAGYNHIAGSSYNVGDLFAIPNSILDGNYIVGRVDSVTAQKAISTYHIYNIGGDYANASNVPAITLTGTGGGATFNVTSATTAGGTFDDTYGLVKAQMTAREAGGATILPDNCWIQTLPEFNGAILLGSDDSPSYNVISFWPGPPFGQPSGARRAPILSVIGSPATYAIDLNGSNGGVLRGFQLIGYTGQTFSQSVGTYATTIGIGSSVADPSGGGGNGAGGQGPWFIDRVGAHYFKYGLGTQGASDPFVFLKLHQNDWGGNNVGGIYGSLSDLEESDDTIAGVNGYCVELTGSGARIGPNNRCEFAGGGWKAGAGGFAGLQDVIHGNQGTALKECGVYINGTQQTTVVGNQFTSVGIGGTLRVTGAADNGAGLIRLTVSGLCSGKGGVALCDVVTGDKANIKGVLGTTEANGNQWTLTKFDNTHIDLVGSAFVNAWVAGGTQTVAVNGKDAPICLNGTTQFYATGNVNFGYGSGFFSPPAVFIDSTGSTSVSIIGGGANNGGANTGTYTQDFANWHNASNTPSANTTIAVQGQPYFDNTNVPTITGISVTGQGGGLNAGYAISATTSVTTMTLGNLPINPTGYNCIGGDSSIPNTWAMSASTSTSCSLAVTTTSGNNIWFNGKAR